MADERDDVREDEHEDTQDDQVDQPHDEAEDDADPEQEDPQGEDDDQQDDQPDDAEPQRQSRGSERIRKKANEAREAADRAAAAERRAEEAERRAAEAERRVTERTQAEVDAEERAAMAAMSDAERTQYLLAKELKGVKSTLGGVQLANAYGRDASSFDRFIARNPRYEKYCDRVEQVVGQAERQGQFLSRHLVFKQLLADDVLNGKANNDQQRRDAKRRVDNARGRGSSARSDAGPRERTSGKGTHVARMERDDPVI